ncbi:MAG: DUF1232 domain-containing protein [Bacteroidales bacterium]|nr:DUF1232 domain-containing protein [Bacteroidales bacterium]
MADRNLTPQELPRFQENFSENAFWRKLKQMGRRAGTKVVYYALVLFYTLKDPATPTRYKAVIAGALGYFILPLDMLPDILPFAGLADDWAALIAAVSYVFTAITPEIKEKALVKLHAWFPNVENPDLGDLQ